MYAIMICGINQRIPSFVVIIFTQHLQSIEVAWFSLLWFIISCVVLFCFSMHAPVGVHCSRGGYSLTSVVTIF